MTSEISQGNFQIFSDGLVKMGYNPVFYQGYLAILINSKSDNELEDFKTKLDISLKQISKYNKLSFNAEIKEIVPQNNNNYYIKIDFKL